METVTNLSSVKLTRKEFLNYIGMLFLAILGISSLLKVVTSVSPKQAKQITKGFGSGPYGV